MDRASKFIRDLPLPANSITPEELAVAAWPHALGKRLAGYTRPVKLVRTCLHVEVEDAVWQRQLFTLSPLILRALAKHLGDGLVTELHFPVMPRRRGPQRALQAAPGRAPGLFADEAEAIEDPVLRGIYRNARKKAGA